eukprot:1288172-Prymnesium_polylepis.1
MRKRADDVAAAGSASFISRPSGKLPSSSAEGHHSVCCVSSLGSQTRAPFTGSTKQSSGLTSVSATEHTPRAQFTGSPEIAGGAAARVIAGRGGATAAAAMSKPPMASISCARGLCVSRCAHRAPTHAQPLRFDEAMFASKLNHNRALMTAVLMDLPITVHHQSRLLTALASAVPSSVHRWTALMGRSKRKDTTGLGASGLGAWGAAETAPVGGGSRVGLNYTVGYTVVLADVHRHGRTPHTPRVPTV